MELDFRKCRILAAIVETYIETGEPVGSKALAEMLGNCVSSATIRNDMAVLTATGYLAQPHTSAASHRSGVAVLCRPVDGSPFLDPAG